ncbi:hypothetical protein [Histidinibacterium aquaticum]|uniref:Uncharacterized protein n=1 Tax=Histidinibacterium aquaticum TaxID=2613962 RepID=A0A5J5GNS9_9RHOB|nr:hypothetical protein [Histidinibacterium aquaticum]KAA9009697.1 hypothetical protein F3S47_00015 [Histidinibacterium aquaticum]
MKRNQRQTILEAISGDGARHFAGLVEKVERVRWAEKRLGLRYATNDGEARISAAEAGNLEPLRLALIDISSPLSVRERWAISYFLEDTRRSAGRPVNVKADLDSVRLVCWFELAEGKSRELAVEDAAKILRLSVRGLRDRLRRFERKHAQATEMIRWLCVAAWLHPEHAETIRRLALGGRLSQEIKALGK